MSRMQDIFKAGRVTKVTTTTSFSAFGDDAVLVEVDEEPFGPSVVIALTSVTVDIDLHEFTITGWVVNDKKQPILSIDSWRSFNKIGPGSYRLVENAE